VGPTRRLVVRAGSTKSGRERYRRELIAVTRMRSSVAVGVH
jgi:hypothetical protein